MKTIKIVFILTILAFLGQSAQAQYSYWKSHKGKLSTGALVLGYKYRDLSQFDAGYSHTFDVLDTYWDYRAEATFGIGDSTKTVNIVNAVYIPWKDPGKLFLLNFGVTNNLNFYKGVNGINWGIEPWVGIDFMYFATLRVGYNYFLKNKSPLDHSLMGSLQVNLPLGLVVPPKKREAR